jgi:RNA polymerase sigma-70 factor (ECF subfamily)
MSSTPVSLLERLRQPHDAVAWSRFVRLYTPLLHEWACRTGLQEADAADLLQDVFTVLVRELPAFQYRAGGSFRGWLRTILLNRWRELRRRRQPTLVTSERLAAVPDVDDPPPPDEVEEQRHLLRGALVQLRPEFEAATWEAFRETMLHGRSAAEVAAQLGLTPNAVYIARSRVLKRLRQELVGLLE